ncbi:MAG: hypothetical protein ABSF90_08560 [Syntrophobacteraceae bacterium]|jgi:hypothetical protein
MARGPSGRIVLEIDPALKRELYSALIKNGITLKDWFVHQAERYLHSSPQQLTISGFWRNGPK